MDRTVLTGSCSPTPVLTVHGINKKSGSLGLKNRFSSRFPIFTVRPPGPVRSGSENHAFREKDGITNDSEILMQPEIAINASNSIEINTISTFGERYGI